MTVARLVAKRLNGCDTPLPKTPERVREIKVLIVFSAKGSSLCVHMTRAQLELQPCQTPSNRARVLAKILSSFFSHRSPGLITTTAKTAERVTKDAFTFIHYLSLFELL